MSFKYQGVSERGFELFSRFHMKVSAITNMVLVLPYMTLTL
jgi:hypothetical protein